MRLLAAALSFFLCLPALAQDYYREKRWSDQIVPGLMVGEAVWIEQENKHKYLTLWTEAENARGAIILGHGRGWSPDYELYGVLRTKFVEQGYSTLSIQLPVLGGGARSAITFPRTARQPSGITSPRNGCRRRGTRTSPSCPTASGPPWPTTT